MTGASPPQLYFSLFMFTANLRPDDRDYTKVIVAHMREVLKLGYVGFDLPIAPTDTADHAADVRGYTAFKQALDDAGLGDVRFTTNVAATGAFDPTSDDPATRAGALAYLKSRVDITAALGGDILAGPIVLPYNVFPVTWAGEGIWADALQEWIVPRYERARPVIDELGDYAQQRGVKIAIEPVDHWETPAPCSVRELNEFLDGVKSPQVGMCIDSAHTVLGSDGPEVFAAEARRATGHGRVHYVHISPPDRGALHRSWIPWKQFLEPLAGYDGPYLVEVFNAIEPFLGPLHLCRRTFWRPGEDAPDERYQDAYTIAGEAIAAVRTNLH
jgi:sugar phosphate isomerase/epimerase